MEERENEWRALKQQLVPSGQPLVISDFVWWALTGPGPMPSLRPLLVIDSLTKSNNSQPYAPFNIIIIVHVLNFQCRYKQRRASTN